VLLEKSVKLYKERVSELTDGFAKLERKTFTLNNQKDHLQA